MKIKQENALGELAGAIGKGLLAGLVGTAAMTFSQMIEMKINGRKPSDAPVKVASQITSVKPENEAAKQKVGQEIHWAYGTALGVSRGLISLTGLKGIPATLVHFGFVWTAAMVMLPSFDVAPPVTEEDPKTIAIDGFHHAIYAIATGLAFDAINAGTNNQRKVDRLISKLA